VRDSDRRPAGKARLDLADAQRWRTLSLPQVIERGAADGERAAIVCAGAVRTWREMREQSRRIGNALVGLGIEAADRVALLAKNRLEYLEIETGIAAACAIMVPVNWRLRSGEIASILSRSGAVAIVVDADAAPTVRALRREGRLPLIRTVVLLDGEAGDDEIDYRALVDGASSTAVARTPRFDDPHEILYTSGTTGDPKGAVWTNGGLFFNAIQQVIDFRMGPESSTFAMIDLFYVGGRHDLTWAALHAGGTVHVKPSGGFDARTALAYVCEHRISHVLWVPTMIYDILRVPDLERFDTLALRMIMCGGQVLSAEAVRRMQAAFPHTDFVQVYGLTEGGGSVTCMPPHMTAVKPGSSGRASFDAAIRIVGDSGDDLPAGSDGEILVRAPSVIAGYWDDAALTAQHIVDDWLHTGDVGRLDDDGYLYVTGRKKDLIKCGGMNVAPAEIEDVLRAHPAVLDAAVIGIPHEKWGEQVCAVVELRPAAAASERELIEHCAAQLASFKKPAVVHFIDGLPRTASGKPLKFILRERFGSRG